MEIKNTQGSTETSAKCKRINCAISFLILEPSLTFENVHNILAEVKDPEKWGNVDGVPDSLQIPDSKLEEMEQAYPDFSQRQSALIQFWFDRHPAPSWELVCLALYLAGEYEVLENVQNKYLKGIVQYYVCVHDHE